MTLSEDKTLRIGIAGSLVVHVALLFILAWLWGMQGAARWLAAQQRAEPEKQVTLLFPDQVIEMKQPEITPPAPPKPLPPPVKPYIRTTQNTAAANAPVKADFVSDRNTLAASRKAASPDGTKPMPTQDGIDRTTMELANRDQRDGEVKNMPDAPKPTPQMRVSDFPPTQPRVVAKADTVPPMTKMMQEADKSMTKDDDSRLALEIKKPTPADAPPEKNEPPSPPVVKAVPIDPKTGKPVPKFDRDAFSPFTRTSKVKGTINNRGEDAVNAAETPMGRYMRAVTAAVEKKWHVYRKQKADAVTFGNLKLRFFVTKDGKAEDMEVLSKPGEADVRMTDFTLRAIKDAEIPPIPADLVPMLDGERVEIEYDVLIY
ncbi:MAG: hypothetical protein K1X78_23090 [Verrucomicrobiaceae bacterium]|nr:hypothetical protein [Verrucomicrobiaceae bacterium]